MTYNIFQNFWICSWWDPIQSVWNLNHSFSKSQTWLPQVRSKGDTWKLWGRWKQNEQFLNMVILKIHVRWSILTHYIRSMEKASKRNHIKLHISPRMMLDRWLMDNQLQSATSAEGMVASWWNTIHVISNQPTNMKRYWNCHRRMKLWLSQHNQWKAFSGKKIFMRNIGLQCPHSRDSPECFYSVGRGCKIVDIDSTAKWLTGLVLIR